MAEKYADKTKVRIQMKDDKIVVDRKKVKLNYKNGNGEHTFYNDLNPGQKIMIIFRRKFLLRKLKTFDGPFPAGGKRRGIYELDGGEKITLNPDIKPDILTDYWKYQVFYGKEEVDPGIRIRR